MNLKEYQNLKSDVDRLQRESDRATGALQQLKMRLRAEFDCATIGQARELLQKLEAEQTAAEKVYEKEFEAFHAKYSERLG